MSIYFLYSQPKHSYEVRKRVKFLKIKKKTEFGAPSEELLQI